MMRTAALSVAIGIVALAAAVPDAGAAESCCFANDLYQGICRVNPGESETCQSTLEYLNNPMSTGKSYCGGTSVRGGWIQVDCKTGKPIIPPDKEKPESEKQTRIARVCTEINRASEP